MLPTDLLRVEVVPQAMSAERVAGFCPLEAALTSTTGITLCCATIVVIMPKMATHRTCIFTLHLLDSLEVGF